MKHLTTALLITTAGLIGCDPATNCSADVSEWSVELQLEDEAGSAVAGAAVSVTDGTTTETCTEEAGRYLCGETLSGDLTVLVEAVGYESAAFDVTTDDATCGGFATLLTETIWSTDCSAEAIPSVLVSVTDEGGAVLIDAEVTYTPLADDFGEAIVPCTLQGEDFVCGYDVDGEILIEVQSSGFQPHQETVTVERTPDGCHVETQALDVIMLTE